MFQQQEKEGSSTTYLLVMLLGVSLSVFVYLSVSKVKDTSYSLVYDQIPALIAAQRVETLLSSQERLLREYYSKSGSKVYIQLQRDKLNELESELGSLKRFIRSQSTVNVIEQSISKIKKTSHALIQNLSADNTDWYLADKQLHRITQQRKMLVPKINEVTQFINQQVSSGHYESQRHLNTTVWIVLVVSIMLVVITFVIAWYVKSYVIETAKSSRLALFPRRSPAAILSLDGNGNIIYGNPSASNLVKKWGSFNQGYKSLIPFEYNELREKIYLSKDNHFTVEHKIGEQIFQCEFHWLKDIDQVDVFFIDITEQKNAQNKLSYQLYHNERTDLANFKRLKNDLAPHFTHVEATNFDLMLIEVRDFDKYVRDFGVYVAEELELNFAHTLKQYTQNSRLGLPVKLYQVDQSHFVCIIEGAFDVDSINALHQHLEEAFEKPVITTYGQFNVDVDFGVVCYPEHGEHLESLLKFAYIALDAAKKTEQMNLVFFSKDIEKQLARKNYLIENLKTAISTNSLLLYFQPQQLIQKQRITGAEVLCRWQLNGEFIPPSEFIPLAEQTGLILELGEWIISSACKQAKEWLDQEFDFVLAVNISPRQFIQPNFIDSLKNTLAKYNLPPQKIELEITEGVLMNNEKDIISTLNELKRLGFYLSIDDFGTGYSSLAYLKQFPVDKLKIDQSFIMNSHQSDEDKVIVKTIIDLAKNLNLSIIAEGVELEEHYEFLRQTGCDEVQGYLFSKPLPKDKFNEFYKANER